MKKTYKIDVPKPCTLNWAEMIPSEKGRYCLNCEKEVVDFTSWTDGQIKEFIQNSNKKICGRILVHPPKNQLPLASRFAFLAFLGLSSIYSIVNGQNVNYHRQIQRSVLAQKDNLFGVQQSDQFKIRGRILSYTDQKPLAGVKVFTDRPWLLSAVTDSLGVFELIIDKKPLQFVEITIVSPGMSAIIKRVSFDRSQVINMGDMTMQKQMEDFSLGEVIITPSR